MAARAVVGGSDDRFVASEHAFDRPGVESRPVGEHDHRAVDVRAERAEAAAERRARADLPVVALNDPCAGRLELVCAFDDDDLRDARPPQRVEDRRQQFALLDPAVARRGASGEHHRGGSSGR